MITNGSLLYKHDSKILKKLSQIQFSIYGCDDLEYKKMTGCSDGFTKLCRSIDFAKQHDIFTKISITLCETTADHIESFIKKAIELGVDYLRIGIADVFGRGKYLYLGEDIFEKQFDEIFRTIIELKRQYQRQIKIELPNINTQHITNHSDIRECVYRGTFQCGCGSEYLVVSQHGDIRPCQMLPESWFSIKNKNALKEHIEGNFHVKQLQDNVKKYYQDNHFQDLNISPCEALDSFVKMEEVSGKRHI